MGLRANEFLIWFHCSAQLFVSEVFQKCKGIPAQKVSWFSKLKRVAYSSACPVFRTNTMTVEVRTSRSPSLSGAEVEVEVSE